MAIRDELPHPAGEDCAQVGRATVPRGVSRGPNRGDVTLWCGSCGLPFARLRSGVLVVQSMHHGDKHLNVVAVSELVQMC